MTFWVILATDFVIVMIYFTTWWKGTPCYYYLCLCYEGCVFWDELFFHNKILKNTASCLCLETEQKLKTPNKITDTTRVFSEDPEFSSEAEDTYFELRNERKAEERTEKKHCSIMSLGELPNNKHFPNYKCCSGQQQLCCLASALCRMGLRWVGFVWWNIGWLALSFSELRSPCFWPLGSLRKSYVQLTLMARGKHWGQKKRKVVLEQNLAHCFTASMQFFPAWDSFNSVFENLLA